MVRMRYNQRLNATDFTHYCNQLSILYYTRTIVNLIVRSRWCLLLKLRQCPNRSLLLLSNDHVVLYQSHENQINSQKKHISQKSELFLKNTHLTKNRNVIFTVVLTIIGTAAFVFLWDIFGNTTYNVQW